MDLAQPTHTNMHTDADAARARRWHAGIIIACLAIGMLLRWAWIFPMHPWTTTEDFKQRYVFSDMSEYWDQAVKLHSAAPHWSSRDAIFPPGPGMLYAVVVGPQMDRISFLQWFQWTTSVFIMAMVYCLARLLFDKRTAAIALFLSAVSFPFFDYSAYTLAENPFTFLLLTAVLIMAFALRRKSLLLLCIAASIFGISALFKSVGLLAGLMLMLMLFSRQWKGTWLYRVRDCLLFVTVMIVTILPTSFAVSARNGTFTLIANDTARLALANHGNLISVTFPLPDGQQGGIWTGLAGEKGFTETRVVQPNENVLLENARWVFRHPFAALFGFLERITDVLGNMRPFPTGATGYRGIVYVSQLLMVLTILAPALGWLLFSFFHASRSHRQAVTLLLLPLAGLFCTVVIAAMEPRYLHPFLPFLAIIAGLAYAERLKKRGVH